MGYRYRVFRFPTRSFGLGEELDQACFGTSTLPTSRFQPRFLTWDFRLPAKRVAGHGITGQVQYNFGGIILLRTDHHQNTKVGLLHVWENHIV